MYENKTKEPSVSGELVNKLIACLVIVICFALGIVGLILPIIPGLLFLAIAAMIAARLSTRLDGWLRRNKTMTSYLDSSADFFELNVAGKIKYMCWLCIKIFIDTIILIMAVIAKLFSFARNKQEYYR